MSNIFKKLGIGIETFGKWIFDAIKDTANIAIKVETILKAEEPLEAQFITGLSTIVADVEALIAASDTAITASGLNLTADSLAYQKVLTLISDFKSLGPIVKNAIEVLEGKATTTTATTTSTTTAS